VPRRTKPIGEFELIALLTKQLERGARDSRSSGIELGMGDDAAVLVAGRGQRLVWTTDACLEGVHFHRDWLSFEDVGFRATMAAVSDLAAMGAEPWVALSSLQTGRTSTRDLEQLARGQAKAARTLGLRFVGGNVTGSTELGIHTSVLGRATAALRRSGARVGHQLWLVGELGLARAGLELVRRGTERKPSGAARCLRGFRRPIARVAEGLALVGRAGACIDVSDGLVADCDHLAEASGVGLALSEPALRAGIDASLKRVAGTLGTDALELVLHGGEDYALVATGPAARRPSSAVVIGRVIPGRGVQLERESGGLEPLLARGFDHLASQHAES